MPVIRNNPPSAQLPPLPPGFQLVQPPAPVTSTPLPPLPDGFQLEHGPWEEFQSTTPASPQVGELRQGRPWEEFQQQPQASLSDTAAPVTAGGLAKAAGAGALSGTVGLPGDIVTLINLARKGYAGLRGNPYDATKDDYSLGQTYNSVRTAADNVYTPKNDAESWFKWGGEMLPAIAAGPEGLAEAGLVDAAKILGRRAITQAAVPAAASAAAGAATQGTAAEPYARAGAALLAGGLGTKVPKAKPPTSAAISALADQHFANFRSAPVTVKPDVVETAAKDIQNDLKSKGMFDTRAAKLVEPYIGNTDAVSLDRLQNTRSLLAGEAGAPGTEGAAAIHAKKAVDSLMDALTPSDTVVGANALSGAMDALRQGRATSAVANQLGLVEKAQNAGEINADVSESARNAVRSQFGSLLKSSEAMRKLGPYQPDISKIARGTALTNTLRGVTKATGSNWHSSPQWLAALLAADLGAGGAISTGIAALPFAGIGLKKWQGVLEKKRVDALKSRIGANAPGLPPPAAPWNPLPARALIGALATGNGNQQPNN